jgi:hypothetical protein
MLQFCQRELRFTVWRISVRQPFGRGSGMNAASTNAYHVVSVIWQPMLSQSRGIDWKSGSWRPMKAASTEETWLVSNADGFTCSDASL